MSSRLHEIAAILETIPVEQREALRPHLRALVEESRADLKAKDEELKRQAEKVASLEHQVRYQARRLGELQEQVGDLFSNRHRWRQDLERALHHHSEDLRKMEDLQGELESTQARESEALVENINLTMALTAARQDAAEARAELKRVRFERITVTTGRFLTSLSAQLLARIQAPWKRRAAGPGIVAARPLALAA